MIRDLLREEIEVCAPACAPPPSQHLALREEPVPFRKCYVEGYHSGRKDESAGLPDASERGGGAEHLQVEVDGIEVDEGIRDLLVALWKLGLDTEYSCQGEPDKFSPNH